MKKIHVLFPTFCVIAFLCLFVFAATLYPGGSQADISSVGYDYINNYWCNLLNINAMNGITNPARPVAIAATFLLCGGVSLFFYQIGKHFSQSKYTTRAIQFSGLISMTAGSLIFTEYHDELTIIACLFGFVALLNLFTILFRKRWLIHIGIGVVALIFMAANNYIYYSQEGISYLPALQKVTFLIVLSWIVAMNFRMLNE